MGKVPGEKR